MGTTLRYPIIDALKSVYKHAASTFTFVETELRLHYRHFAWTTIFPIVATPPRVGALEPHTTHSSAAFAKPENGIALMAATPIWYSRQPSLQINDRFPWYSGLDGLLDKGRLFLKA